MDEAEQQDLTAYSSLTELFTRKLQAKSRQIANECLLVRTSYMIFHLISLLILLVRFHQLMEKCCMWDVLPMEDWTK